ncbi:MAG: hypothetical protein A2504_08375 [Bdellovibrionales bacterium RIFOXYD12_FULL_39_22]|nr:MAG: hypothetical protein A2385_01600 [Bdellovibrionales bacterium RIFOXYB1_FULL_39_21]OFZ42860.1 MAG: hypothetical protein A2485_10770 [Bdellovibrionales bacterium RIFOXYC12_FULL_39_17]OFZ47480.1 MAG: hypothetical protein A2404_14520 [Bdellovibrionales bacterium RIFOXYC1_FULL_39_130]OFZ71097.1 MAG: hypothetical protein A2451_10895 [Bdellovibrionales bacterium RIFOXYC2_FULL_39_8]OFZ75568.1 MAG: hypothetical protein A2560_14670 [Bdellovibrionales bacterium RIFOXYD1_FULL_39_84]OFZ93891.1 MAG:
MLKLIPLFFLILPLIRPTLAVDTKFSGFIAVDLMKAVKENQADAQFNNGIGAIDLKFSAFYEKFSSKIKLDLDDSSLDTPYNIFEEASVVYTHSPQIKLEMGKGKVSFSKQIRGAIEASYLDGGSLLGTNHSWYDVDNKNLIELTFGSKELGFFNHFTIYSDKYESKSSDLRLRRGIANNFEFFPRTDLTAAVAAIYLQDNTVDANERNWALDFNAQYNWMDFEFFFEYQYGTLKTDAEVYHGAIDAKDHIIQLGFEQKYDELINFLFEVETAIVDKQCNNRDSEKFKNKHLEQTVNKIEAGTKFKMEKNIFFTVGALYEHASQEIEDVVQPRQNAYQLATTLSYWF